MRKVVYIAHPLGAGPDREQNRRNAAKWVAWAARQGVAPVADWIVLSGELEETPANRLLGLECDRALVELCDEVWLVGGRVSPGMAIEAEHARLCLVPVVDKTSLGPLPPN
jgi:hypothetical protein